MEGSGSGVGVMAWDHRYRQLQEGEIVQHGDEVLCDKEWEPAGRTVGSPAPSPLYTSHRKYRRLKEGDGMMNEHSNLEEIFTFAGKVMSVDSCR